MELNHILFIVLILLCTKNRLIDFLILHPRLLAHILALFVLFPTFVFTFKTSICCLPRKGNRFDDCSVCPFTSLDKWMPRISRVLSMVHEDVLRAGDFFHEMFHVVGE